MKKKIIVLIVSLALIIHFMICFANVQLVFFNEELHREKFTAYNVYEELKEHDINKIHAEVIGYIRDNNKLETDFFNDMEKQHLGDVKQLVNIASVILYVLIVLFLILTWLLSISSKGFLKMISKAFIGGSLITIIFSGINWVIVQTGFAPLFTSFHKILFPQGNWLFDPDLNNIVILYPPEFWQDMFMQFFKDVLFWAFIALLFGILIYVLVRNRVSDKSKES